MHFSESVQSLSDSERYLAPLRRRCISMLRPRSTIRRKNNLNLSLTEIKSVLGFEGKLDFFGQILASRQFPRYT